MIYYLIVNSKGQPLFKEKTGQIFLYTTVEGALKKLQKDFVKDNLKGRHRAIMKKAIFIDV